MERLSHLCASSVVYFSGSIRVNPPFSLLAGPSHLFVHHLFFSSLVLLWFCGGVDLPLGYLIDPSPSLKPFPLFPEQPTFTLLPT